MPGCTGRMRRGWRRSDVPRSGTRRPGPVLAPSVEAELVALDVLHDEARLVLLVGHQETHPPGAERFESSPLLLEHGHARLAGQPPADPYVEVDPVLHRLGLGHPLEEQAWADPVRVLAGPRGPAAVGGQ